jgi:L-ascorbate metabolism protein UlaG (beta-lactamase superfamily)
MDAREACEVANRIGPKVAIPMHYGSVIGSIKDAEAFVQCVGDIGVILPQRKK